MGFGFRFGLRLSVGVMVRALGLGLGLHTEQRVSFLGFGALMFNPLQCFLDQSHG